MKITPEMITLVKKQGGCKVIVDWLEEKERTWDELVEKHPDWAVLAMTKIPDCPINLEGLTSAQKALVMIRRKDCPVNLEGLTDYDKRRVLIRRKEG